MAELIVGLFGGLLEVLFSGLLEVLLTPVFWYILLVPAILLATPGILFLAAFRSGHYLRDVKELYCGMAAWWIRAAKHLT